MVSDFRKKKLMYLFQIFFDADGSGVVTKKDIELGIERLAQARGWAPGGEKYKKGERTMMDIWEGMLDKAGANKDGEITADEWIQLWDSFAKNPNEPADWQAYYCKSIFNVQDASGDGVIDKEEYQSVQESFGLPRDKTGEAYDKLANGKSTISWEDFQKRWEEFFNSEDINAPGNYIFGHGEF